MIPFFYIASSHIAWMRAKVLINTTLGALMAQYMKLDPASRV
jgi:hypothetical protein